jgi:oxygen-independent coproporphyrinogen-3 oxidase
MGSLSIHSDSRVRPWTYLPRYAEEVLPRFTSYPPANRFDASIGPAQMLEALGQLPPDASLSLYLHIPFCRQLCWYCGCHTSVPTQADPIDTYLAAMRQEIAVVGRAVPAGARVTRIHLGGGSPDILSARQIADLFGALRREFSVSPFADIAAELDPRGAGSEVVEALADAGLTRASLGVQVLDSGVQDRINRRQPRDVIEAAVSRLRASGISSLNVDLMYGLPGQTIQHVVEAATFAALQDADRVAVFGYAHVPWFKKHQKAIHQEDLPAGEARFRQAEAASLLLQRAGYCAVGFDHFAAPGDSLATAERLGRLRRNFQGYTDDDAIALVGIGASAISSLPGLFAQNTPDTAAYRLAGAEARPATVRGARLAPRDIRIGRLIERLLCDFEAEIPADLRIAACPRLTSLAEAGVVEWRGSRLTVTARGRPYVRNVAASFDPAFGAGAARHSLAI